MAERPMPYGYYADESVDLPTEEERPFTVPLVQRSSIDDERTFSAPPDLQYSSEPLEGISPGSGYSVAQPTVETVERSPGESPQPDVAWQQTDPKQYVARLMHFFLTLLQKCDNIDRAHSRPIMECLGERAKVLIVHLITGHKEPEEFAYELQTLLHSRANPRFVPFLRKTLPHFIEAAVRGKVDIDCLVPEHVKVVPRRTRTFNAEHLHAPRPGYPPNVYGDVSNSESQGGAREWQGGAQEWQGETQTWQNGAQGWQSGAQEWQDATQAWQETTKRNNCVQAEDLRFLPDKNVVQYETISNGILQYTTIHPNVILEKIKQCMKVTCSVEEDSGKIGHSSLKAIVAISDAAENRVRELIENLVAYAVHANGGDDPPTISEEEYARLVQESAARREQRQEQGQDAMDKEPTGSRGDEAINEGSEPSDQQAMAVDDAHAAIHESANIAPVEDANTASIEDTKGPVEGANTAPAADSGTTSIEDAKGPVEDANTAPVADDDIMLIEDAKQPIEDVDTEPMDHEAETRKDSLSISKGTDELPEGMIRVRRPRVTLQCLHYILREDPLFKGTKARMNFTAGYFPSHG
ncbi:hypothetical protein GCK32_001110 [Trichostrongylus colubriformis]|uniref:TAFH domain-containing protein n=1 Tax=Trichostrongylus colubriformis TaxID=6319 RepID=A0AAN8ICV3_TRICO